LVTTDERVLLLQGVACEQMKMTLARYTQLQHAGNPLRCIQLLMLLPRVHTVNAHALETLFFKESIGDVSMSRLVSDLYSSSSGCASAGGVQQPVQSSLSPTSHSGSAQSSVHMSPPQHATAVDARNHH